MSSNKKDKNLKKIFIFMIIFIILLIIFFIVLLNKNNEENWQYGEVPGGISIYTGEDSSSDVTSGNPPSMPTIQDYDNDEKIVYPEEVDFWEESITGGGIPQKYTDKDGNNYTKKYFPSLGYLMYIPDDWTRINHSNDYLQNTYYLVSDKENYENIQMSVTTKTATRGLSPSEARNLFQNTHQNMEYYFKHGDYKFITTMYETAPIHQITTEDIPGFENYDKKILVYYDEPKVTFVMDKDPTYFTEPYVINYYIIKDNVAVMLTCIGPRKHAGEMNYLLASMGLNCKELYNTNATNIRYSTDKKFDSGLLTLDAPSDWILSGSDGYTYKIGCSGVEKETSALYGTEILMSRKYIEKTSGQKPQSILSNKDATASIAYSSLDYNSTITYMIMQNLNYSINYTPSDISEVVYGTNVLTRIDFTLSIDESSLFNKLAITENPVHASIYIKETEKGFAFVVIKYMKNNESYIESLSEDILSNVTWPK